jgi:hypothetical protein
MFKSKRNLILGLATIILFLGLGITIYLVRQNQEIRRKASSGSACEQSPDCDLVGNGQNSGSYTAARQITYVDITDQNSTRYYPGNTNDGCHDVHISGNQVTWNKIGPGPGCKDVSNVQVWLGNGAPSVSPTETTTPTPAQTITTSITPTTNLTHTVTPTRNPSLTATNTPTHTTTPTVPAGSTNTPTPTPTEPGRGGGDSPTPTSTATPTTTAQNSATPTPTTNNGVIAATSPTPKGDTLPQAGVGTLTIMFSAFGMLAFIGAGLLFLL